MSAVTQTLRACVAMRRRDQTETSVDGSVVVSNVAERSVFSLPT
ncbi:MAG TPA: hypothetical protein VMV29_03365 [Ktedonobacterales bacterium]|nr:hypothetical protein [Ktedonobacterales bacterium]